MCQRALEADPPCGAHVEFQLEKAASGWDAPPQVVVVVVLLLLLLLLLLLAAAAVAAAAVLQVT